MWLASCEGATGSAPVVMWLWSPSFPFWVPRRPPLPGRACKGLSATPLPSVFSGANAHTQFTPSWASECLSFTTRHGGRKREEQVCYCSSFRSDATASGCGPEWCKARYPGSRYCSQGPGKRGTIHLHATGEDTASRRDYGTVQSPCSLDSTPAHRWL